MTTEPTTAELWQQLQARHPDCADLIDALKARSRPGRRRQSTRATPTMPRGRERACVARTQEGSEKQKRIASRHSARRHARRLEHRPLVPRRRGKNH